MYVKKGENLSEISWIPGMAFDFERGEIVYTPIATEDKAETAGKVKEGRKAELKEAAKEHLVGRAIKVLHRLERHREIQRLQKEFEALRMERFLIYENFYHMREKTPVICAKL